MISQVGLLKVLAHPMRLRLVQALGEGEECVCHLTALLNQRQAYVSQQLMFLRRAGLLQDRKEGARVYYRIKDPRLHRILEAIEVPNPRAEPADRYSAAACPCPRCQAGRQQSNRGRRKHV